MPTPFRLFARFLATAVVIVSFAGPVSRPAAAAADLYAPVLTSARDDVIARTAGTLSSYAMDIAVDPIEHTLKGTERIDFVNATGTTVSEVPFRLFPNAAYYDEGGVDVIRARVAGNLVTPRFDADDTVMYLPLSEPLADGERVNLALRFETTVPVDSSGTFGVFSLDLDRNEWILADWFPILAGWEIGKGWVLDPPTSAGDPTFSETALYNVTLEMPSGWGIAATGNEQQIKTNDDLTTWNIVSGPAREFSMVLDDDFQVVSDDTGGTTISVYFDGNGAAEQGARLTLDAARESLETYSDAFGVYPFDELDLVEAEMNGALGVSWSGLIFLNGDRLLSNPDFVRDDPERLRFTVAHEVGHQWWGALVGMNSNDHTFLVEGLTNYLAVYGIEQMDGKEAADNQLRVQSVNPYLNALAQHGDGVADIPIEFAPSSPPFGTLIYGKAALGFLAIRQAIGDDAFFTAIHDWAEEFQFSIAGPDDLRAAFERAAGSSVDDLWNFWFKSADTTESDVQALIDQS